MCVMQGSRVELEISVVCTVIKRIASNNTLPKSCYHGGVLFDVLHSRAVLPP